MIFAYKQLQQDMEDSLHEEVALSDSKEWKVDSAENSAADSNKSVSQFYYGK